MEKSLTVHTLYCKIISVLEDTSLVKPNDSNKLYSPASIGKLYLEKLNIKPFLEKNPEFAKYLKDVKGVDIAGNSGIVKVFLIFGGAMIAIFGGLWLYSHYKNKNYNNTEKRH